MGKKAIFFELAETAVAENRFFDDWGKRKAVAKDDSAAVLF